MKVSIAIHQSPGSGMYFGNMLVFSPKKKQALEIDAINLGLRSGVGKWEMQHPSRLIHLYDSRRVTY